MISLCYTGKIPEWTKFRVSTWGTLTVIIVQDAKTPLKIILTEKPRAAFNVRSSSFATFLKSICWYCFRSIKPLPMSTTSCSCCCRIHVFTITWSCKIVYIKEISPIIPAKNITTVMVEFDLRHTCLRNHFSSPINKYYCYCVNS